MPTLVELQLINIMIRAAWTTQAADALLQSLGDEDDGFFRSGQQAGGGGVPSDVGSSGQILANPC